MHFACITENIRKKRGKWLAKSTIIKWPKRKLGRCKFGKWNLFTSINKVHRNLSLTSWKKGFYEDDDEFCCRMNENRKPCKLNHIVTKKLETWIYFLPAHKSPWYSLRKCSRNKPRSGWSRIYRKESCHLSGANQTLKPRLQSVLTT